MEILIKFDTDTDTTTVKYDIDLTIAEVADVMKRVNRELIENLAQHDPEMATAFGIVVSEGISDTISAVQKMT